MRASSLLSLGLVAIGAYAKPTIRASSGLEVSLSTPANKVASASEIRVVATVKNVGNKDLKVIKLGTVLDNELPTRSFIVTKDGKEVPFTGIEALIQVGCHSAGDCVVIPTGKNVTAEHDVSAVYDFTGTGPGNFTFEPVSSFQAIGVDDTVETISATNTDDIRSVSITVAEDASKRELNLEKRMMFNCTDAHERGTIELSFLDARYLAYAGLQYAGALGNKDPYYKTYFGSNSISQVKSNFKTILEENSTEKYMNCDYTPSVCNGGAILYTVGDNTYYCPAYFTLRDSGSFCKDKTLDSSDTRAGRTLQALTYTLLAADGNLPVGCADVQKLTDPDKIKSPGSYMCFASQAYKILYCP